MREILKESVFWLLMLLIWTPLNAKFQVLWNTGAPQAPADISAHVYTNNTKSIYIYLKTCTFEAQSSKPNSMTSQKNNLVTNLNLKQ